MLLYIAFEREKTATVIFLCDGSEAIMFILTYSINIETYVKVMTKIL